MNIRKFQRELSARQDNFDIQWVRRDEISKTMNIMVQYIGPPAPKTLLLQKLKDQWYKDKAQELMDIALKQLLPAVKPRCRKLKIHVAEIPGSRL